LGVAMWARQTRWALPGLYALGLVVVGLVLHALGPTPDRLPWTAALALAAHAGLASLTVRAWQTWASGPVQGDSKLRLPYPLLLAREWMWFLPAQLLVGTAVILLALGVAVTQPDLPLRMAGPAAVVLLMPAAWWLARALPEALAEALRLTAL